jgi:prephenate dehydratase
VIQQFGGESNEVEIYPKNSIGDCFDAINEKQVDYAIVPFENSTNGQVVFTYDLLRDWYIPSLNRAGTPTFKIVAEQYVSIHHNFLSNATSRADIKTIYSHPQVWTQVKSFMTNIPSNIAKIDTSSTSKAAELVHNDKTNTSACISSKMSADLFKLPILDSAIEDNPNNTTRFLVLGYEPVESQSKDSKHITTVLFTLNNDNPGALCDVLYCFKKNGVNLGSISSRPSHIEQWQYVFFVEISGSVENDNIANSLKQIEQHCLDMVILGSFERSWRYEN